MIETFELERRLLRRVRDLGAAHPTDRDTMLLLLDAAAALAVIRAAPETVQAQGTVEAWIVDRQCNGIVLTIQPRTTGQFLALQVGSTPKVVVPEPTESGS